MSEPKAIPTEDLSELIGLLEDQADIDLLELVGKHSDDQKWAEAAFLVFHTRHAKYLWAACRSVASKLNGDAWVSDVFSEAFAKVFEVANAKRGYFDFLRKVPPGSQTNLMKAWLGKAAECRLREVLRGHSNEYTKDEAEWLSISDKSSPLAESSFDSPPGSPELDLITEAIESLSEREQLVLRTTFQFHRVGAKHQRLPNGEVQELAEQLNTTPENLRKIRERAMRKVSEFVSSKKTASNVNVSSK